VGGCPTPKVLVAVAPPILADLLTEVLSLLGEDEVTAWTAAGTRQPRQHFDAAIASSPLGDDAVADLVIQLPGPGETVGVVRTASGSAAASLPGLFEVLDLLDAHCPIGRLRGAFARSLLADHAGRAGGRSRRAAS
jgi:hypothetical protein